jgi:steroid delta-isomerase-like uncharacterized protein
MSTESKAIVRRLYQEVWNKRKIAVVDELLSASHALHDPTASGSQVGPGVYKGRVTELTTALPDLHITIEDLIVEGDKVAACWTISGTHQGEFMEISATGKKVSLEGITIHHLRNGKILDSFARWDVLGLMRQIGAAPAPGRMKEAASRG